jgi:hypothetical protein
VALEIPGFGGMTKYEVDRMYEAINQQLTSAGLEPDPSLSPRQVVTAMLKENNKSNGLPFQVRMTGSMVAGVTEFHEALLSMRDTSPETFARFLDLLRAAVKK